MSFLFVDRILELSPGETVRGVKHITRDDYYLCHDEEGKLCFMPSLIGETLGQLVAWNVMACKDFTLRPVAGIVANARLHRSAYVGETLLLESFIDSLDDGAVQYHSVARVGEEIVFSIEGALGPLLPMEEFIDAHEVRRQFAMINRPGERFQDVNTQALLDISSTAVISPMLFDRILLSEPGVTISAEKRITRAAPYFSDHFPNKPVLPMTVLLECQLNLAREFIMRAGFAITYQISELCKIKMNDFIHPGDVVICRAKVKEQNAKQLILNFRSEVAGKRVCVLDIIMVAKGN